MNLAGVLSLVCLGVAAAIGVFAAVKYPRSEGMSVKDVKWQVWVMLGLMLVLLAAYIALRRVG